MPALQEMLESVLEHMGMSADLQIVRRERTDDVKTPSQVSNRYSLHASSWPNSAVWTRCLGALDCLQVRYLQRPSNEHLLPALPASFQPTHSAVEMMQCASPGRNMVRPVKQTDPLHERCVSVGGNEIDAAQAFRVSVHGDGKVRQQPTFVQAGVPVGSVLPSSHADQRHHRSEPADSECSMM